MHEANDRSPRSHSHIPGLLGNPNTFACVGRRTSPSKRRTLSCDLDESVQARFAAVMLLPSCGTVLVIRIFFSVLPRRKCFNLTPRRWKASTAGLSFSGRHTLRVLGA